MGLGFMTATAAGARAIVALHEEVARHRRAALPGARPWKVPSERSIVASMRTTETIVLHDGDVLVATFRLDPARGFHGVARFTEVGTSVYLLEMAVLPSRHGEGIGRRCLEEAERRARESGAGAIRLDTNDDAARAAAFYAACGYREVTRYARTIYLERLLTAESAALR
jgi:GNAT superfamily N-acetyltransferase